MFHALTHEDINRIVDVQLRRLEQLLAERRITLELTPEAKAFLAERGFDPVYGAHSLKRAIQREVQDLLAVALLEGRVQEGDHLVIDSDGNALMFMPVSAVASFE
ncbi:MAG: hypothetical protein SF029_00180 [bacterium]|nr:hypothetical protein [bacterium]